MSKHIINGVNNTTQRKKKKYSLNNTLQSQGHSYYMYGRFQPYTLGHHSLFNQMIDLASKTTNGQVYLFISYKKTKPKQTPEGTIINIHNTITNSGPGQIESLKSLLKTPNTIMNSPLNTRERITIIANVIGVDLKKQYKAGIISYSVDTNIHPVICNIINTEEYKPFTSFPGSGFMKCAGFIEAQTGIVKGNIYMMTGSDRSVPAGISSVVEQRNNDNASLNVATNKLSGSKIRALSLLNRVQDISRMYKGTPIGDTPGLIDELIIKPISYNIFSYPVKGKKQSAQAFLTNYKSTISGKKRSNRRSRQSNKRSNKRSNRRSKTKLNSIEHIFLEIDD